GVGDDYAALEFVKIDAQFNAVFAARGKFDGRGTTEGGRVMILGASGNIDDDGFCVAADVDPVDLALPRPGEAVEGGANGYGHGAGAGDARASGSFRIGSEGEAALRDRKSVGEGRSG